MLNQFEPIKGGYIKLIGCDGTDKDIDRAARISYDGDDKDRSPEDVKRLINRLMREWHTSPFEMVHFKFEVKAPIFVLRQWMRHRTGHFNEQSARYTVCPDEFYIPNVNDVRGQHTHDKQAGGDGLPDDVAFNFVDGCHITAEHLHKNYCGDIENGVARELARINLPHSMFSRMIWKVAAHNLFHFMQLRSDWHAQLEIRRYSDCLQKIVERELPLSYAAWVEHRRDAVTLSASQWAAIREQINPDDTALQGVQLRELKAKVG